MTRKPAHPPAIEGTPEQVKDIISRSGLTQAEVAKLIGVASLTTSNWVTGNAFPRGPARRLLHVIDKLGYVGIHTSRFFNHADEDVRDVKLKTVPPAPMTVEQIVEFRARHKLTRHGLSTLLALNPLAPAHMEEGRIGPGAATRRFMQYIDHVGVNEALYPTASIHEPLGDELSARDIVVFRRRLAMDRTEFAKLLGVSRHTLVFWEDGRGQPLGTAIKMMQVIDRHGPEVSELIRRREFTGPEFSALHKRSGLTGADLMRAINQKHTGAPSKWRNIGINGVPAQLLCLLDQFGPEFLDNRPADA